MEPNAARAVSAGRRESPIETADLERLVAAVETAFHGKRDVVRLALVALLARGHILFEDIPGVGKTTLARALAAALGLEFRRIQFTSDLLPSDILGVSLYNPATSSFETRPGPIFTNIVVADEINRAPPRTQSGLLEAMQEGRVSIDDVSHPLPNPFLVMATQNPLEHHGTYPLPESQLDRFLMRLVIGYPDPAAERRILLDSVGAGDVVAAVPAVADAAAVLRLQDAVERVEAESSLVDYLMQVIAATRSHTRLEIGASPRAAIAMFRAARAHALVDGRTFLAPDDVQAVAVPCLAHRLIPAGAQAGTNEVAEESGVLLAEILTDIPVPV
jgi:MoxR-like ATPase